MKLINKISIFFLAIGSLVSCTKEELDTAGPIINIVNIPDNKEYKFGDNLVMQIKLKSNIGVYEYQYEIYAKEFAANEFTVPKKHVTFEGYYNEKDEIVSVILPEKSATANFKEGEYVIEIVAADINQNTSKYFKPIKIVYPQDK